MSDQQQQPARGHAPCCHCCYYCPTAATAQILARLSERADSLTPEELAEELDALRLAQ